MRVSLSGAGFLGSFHLGVADALTRTGALSEVTIAGASAGAIVGAVAVSGTPISVARKALRSLSEGARAAPMGMLTPGNDLIEQVRLALDDKLPADAHTRASGHLHVALTSLQHTTSWRWSERKRFVSEFGSRDELIDCVCASSDIPGLTARLRATARSPASELHEARRSALQWLLRRDVVDGGLLDLFPDPWRGQPAPSAQASPTALPPPPTHFVSPFAGVGFAVAPPRHVDAAGRRTPTVPVGHGRRIELGRANLQRYRHAFFPPPPEVLAAYEREGLRHGLDFLAAHGWRDEPAAASGSARGAERAASEPL
jgi:hypothetical protein